MKVVKKPARKLVPSDGMAAYTQWGSRYPWHVSSEPYPRDSKGDCTCKCTYCRARGRHKATRAAHLSGRR